MSVTTGPKIATFSGAALDDLYLSEGNQMLRMLQALVQCNALDITDTPPVSPADGDTYIVDVGATGVWTGHDGQIAYYTTQNLSTAAWEFWVPKEGWLVYIVSNTGFFSWDGTQWIPMPNSYTGPANFTGTGTAVTVNMSPGYATAADYVVEAAYVFPTTAPGILSIEYVSGTQFKIHSSSGTDASTVRFLTKNQ